MGTMGTAQALDRQGPPWAPWAQRSAGRPLRETPWGLKVFRDLEKGVPL